VKVHRQATIASVGEAMDVGARRSAAPDIIGLGVRTLQRWEQPGNTKHGRLEAVHTPNTTYTPHEREQMIALTNAPEYAALLPNKLVPTLADEGR
jgi:putative transposase